MFKPSYTLFDSVWTCRVLQVHRPFRLENETYTHIKRITRNCGWKYRRVETIDQDAFPDIIVFKGVEYWLIESKVLRKKRLVSIADDLTWQPGQLSFMKRSHTLRMNYLLFVYCGAQLAALRGDFDEQGQRVNYPDFIG